MGEISFADEISCGDEIRLDGGWVDFISSAKQISSGHCSDFIALYAISLKTLPCCDNYAFVILHRKGGSFCAFILMRPLSSKEGVFLLFKGMAIYYGDK